MPSANEKAARNGPTNGVKPESTAVVTKNNNAAAVGYPDLPDVEDASYEAEAWKAGGIRFAPLRIPLDRRLQTLSVLFHSLCVTALSALFWFIIAVPLSWPFMVPYLILMSFSTAGTDGSLAKRSEWLRSMRIWTFFAEYFPVRLYKTHDLPANRKYIFGYHPHGIISHGAWAALATNALGFTEKFPGITNTLLTLDNNFRAPLYRDWILGMGMGSVSKESIKNILSRGGPKNDGEGRAVTIVIGGARESLEAQPFTNRLVLKDRKGFVKLALQTGADLVPIFGFGENDLYDQLRPETHPTVHKFQMMSLKFLKFTLPALHGRGVLNYDVGLMPYRRPVHVVIGKPIIINEDFGGKPPQEAVDRYHDLYIKEIQNIWEAYKDQFCKNRTAELMII